MSAMVNWQGGLIDPHDPADLDLACEWLNHEYKMWVQPMVEMVYGSPKEDPVAHNTAFNDWTDGLCKDGTISDQVYNQVCRED